MASAHYCSHWPSFWWFMVASFQLNVSLIGVNPNSSLKPQPKIVVDRDLLVNAVLFNWQDQRQIYAKHDLLFKEKQLRHTKTPTLRVFGYGWKFKEMTTQLLSSLDIRGPRSFSQILSQGSIASFAWHKMTQKQCPIERSSAFLALAEYTKQKKRTTEIGCSKLIQAVERWMDP